MIYSWSRLEAAFLLPPDNDNDTFPGYFWDNLIAGVRAPRRGLQSGVWAGSDGRIQVILISSPSLL